MKPLLMLIFILFSLFGFGTGFLLVTKPALAIEIQKRFYAKINWRIEPISMEKELRNTRLMGFTLIILLLATLYFVFARIPSFCSPKL